MVIIKDFLTPEEGIRHQEPQTTLYISDKEVGKGTLYITESLFSWVNNDTREGFSIEYSNITLHATCPETPQLPQCLYIMVDAKVDFPDSSSAEVNNQSNNSTDSTEDDDNSDPIITEMKFVPVNKNNLKAMFEAMSECQALHPDPQDNYTDDEEDIYEDAEEDEEYSDAGDNVDMHSPEDGVNHNGNGTEDAMDIEAGQFEDAEEDP